MTTLNKDNDEKILLIQDMSLAKKRVEGQTLWNTVQNERIQILAEFCSIDKIYMYKKKC